MESQLKGSGKNLMFAGGLVAALFVLFATSASADMAAAKKWVDQEFQPSTLTRNSR